MIADGLPLILLTLAAALHATWNALVKRADSSDPLFVWVTSALGAPVFCALLAWWVLLGGGLGSNWWAALVSTVLHTIYALVLQRAYRAADLSVVYPASRGLAPILVTVAAVALGAAQPNVAVWVALPIVLVGVVLTSDLHPMRTGRGIGVRYGLLIAGCTAAYTLWDSYAARILAVDAVPYVAVSSLAQVLLLTFAMGRRVREMPNAVRREWKTALPITVLAPLSYGLVFVAMRYAPPEMVATTRNLNIVFGVLVGVALLRERPSRRAWLGTAVIIAGALVASI
ncbi:drug/metabolite transporter (DMT)-like permease [Pseudoclavibacter sp. JAI123]|uniref:DMT family transporter n=1 Tax=Pseudoclavibacter sp. JAI123 TaxID=2723065 RepID=UPI001832EF32|nr:DMT family transporter [Pseudoclavibacter sp. JAI123]NYF14861.1 drug/metabolite transporter (DMT)-like permease [Pseudoclavibacter sp. JAI123]